VSRELYSFASSHVGVAGGLGTQNASAENVTLRSIGGDAALERRWSLGALGLGLGAGAEADVIWQSLQRTDATRVAAAGYPTTQQFRGLAPGPFAIAHLRAPIGSSAWLEVAARGGVLFPEMSGGPGGVWTARAALGAGVQF
jgi:hypothetical protein